MSNSLFSFFETQDPEMLQDCVQYFAYRQSLKVKQQQLAIFENDVKLYDNQIASLTGDQKHSVQVKRLQSLTDCQQVVSECIAYIEKIEAIEQKPWFVDIQNRFAEQ